MKNKRSRWFISAGALSGLVLGFALGLIFLAKPAQWTDTFVTYCELFGKTWVLFVFLITIPLVIFFIISSILSLYDLKKAGKIVGYGILYHYTIFLLGLLFSIFFGYAILGAWKNSIPRIKDVSAVQAMDFVTPDSLTGSVDRLILQILTLQKMLGEIFIYLFIAAVIFGLLSMLFKPGWRKRIHSMANKAGDEVMSFFTKVLLTLPFAVFCLILPLSAKTGIAALEISVIYIIIDCLLVITFTVILYSIVHFFGSVPIFTFFRSMIPSNLFALTSRSSMATIPAMMESAEKGMKIPSATTSIIVPFFITAFKLNNAVTAPFVLLFMGWVFGIPISFQTLMMYCGAFLFLSIGSPGVPSSAKSNTLPIMLAAGLPVEAYILVKVLDDIPDMFKTNLNVTHTMTLVTLISGKQNPLELSAEVAVTS